jgi:hypothetical protein
MKKRNRRIHRHQKTASQHRKPPKKEALAPKHQGVGSQSPPPNEHKGPSENQIHERITSEILFLLYLKIRNMVLRADPIEWVWHTVLKPLWDWVCFQTLPHMPYTGA